MSWAAIGTAVVGAGVSAYGASQGGDAPPPVQNDPGKALLKYLTGLNKGLPQLTEMEGQYRPQFGQLNINDQQQFLNALLGMGGQSGAAAQGQLQAQRQADYGAAQGNIGSVLGILGGIDPAGQRLAQQAGQMASQRYDAAQSLNPQEQRMATQTAREGFASRGRLNDNASVSAEILSREDVLARKRAEAMAMGGSALGMTQGFTSPAMNLLMGTPASTALGQDYLSRSMGIIGQNGPQFINPDAGINMGAQNAANLNSYNMAQAASRQNSAAQWGQAGSSLMQLAGTLYQNRE